jgi:hypothetical protein
MLAAAALLVTSFTFGVPGVASAGASSAVGSAISPNGCQYRWLALSRLDGSTELFQCSRTYTVNYRISHLSAGPWSGTYTARAINGPVLTYDFCDYDEINVGGQFMYSVSLSPNKARWCS